MAVDPEDFRTRTTRGSRGGAGPSGFREMYTGPGHSPRSGTSQMPKLIRQIKGVTDKAGRCLYCTHKAKCKCECPCNT
jgi:hypothetical protein